MCKKIKIDQFVESQKNKFLPLREKLESSYFNSI